MYGTSTLTVKGQVTIPQEMRLLLGIQRGDKVYFEADHSQKAVSLKKAQSRSVVNQLAGSLKSPVGYVPISVVRQKTGVALAQKYRLRK